MEIQSKNNLFPVFLKLENFRVLIVGGGKVGLEKASAILSNSPATKVRLVAAQVSGEIIKLKAWYENLEICERDFSNDDLKDTDLVVVAVNNPVLSAEIKRESSRRNILTNVADTPEQCDFFLGSIVQKGHLKIAVSTNGKSPTLAKRIREMLEHALPDEISTSIGNMHTLRAHLKGDFAYKIAQLNQITDVLISNYNSELNKATGIKKTEPESFSKRPGIFERLVDTLYPFSGRSQTIKLKFSLSRRRIWFYSISVPLLVFTGYLLYPLVPPASISPLLYHVVDQVDSSFLLFVLAGFTAQMIDGALGMAYGITATTFLLSFGIPPAASSASVHASEVFTSGASGLMHLKFGNVNSKLFRNLLVPGVLGAIAGAYILSSFQAYSAIINPLVSIYTLILGFVIILKALKKDKIRQKIRKIFPLAFTGGFLDSIGGGGWGPIVASTLIAKGRHPRYSIGSVNLAEFFIALASSLTFFTLIGINHLLVVTGLIIGGIIASPLAVYFTNKIPARTLMILVGIIVIILSLKRIFF